MPQEKVTQIFHTHISGGVAHIGGKESHGGSNALHVGSMQDSQIQQSGEGAMQTGTFLRGSEERSDLEKLTATLSEHLDDLKLEGRARRKVETQIATIKAQLEDEEPDAGIIAQSGRTLRNLTEGVIGNLIAAAIQPAVWQWVAYAMRTHFPK